VLGASVMSVGCATDTGTGALIGGGTGAAIGGLAGAATGHPLVGAALGAGAGAVVGGGRREQYGCPEATGSDASCCWSSDGSG